MTEADATATLVAIGDVLATYVGLWVSVTFAYLTVAYLVGRDLSHFQNVAITALYLVSASFFGLAALGHTDAFLDLNAQEATVYSAVFMVGILPAYLPGLAVIFFGGICVCLYFMYNVRHSEKT